MAHVTNAEFNAIRDAMIAAGAATEAAWTNAAVTPYAAKDDAWKANRDGLKLEIFKQVLAAIPTSAISGPEVGRVGAFYAGRLAAGDLAAAAWTATKAAFPKIADATLEAHKPAALAFASDHPRGYPGA